MYDIGAYSRMMADEIRMSAYAAALRQAVRPGSVVVDIGTGTGIHAMLACRLGARRVYAIEPDDAIQVGREIAEANGCADRIEFIQELSTRVTLSERADVIVSDLRGVLPLFGAHLPAIADARRRFLAPGGTLIPQCDRLFAAVVEAPDLYERHVGFIDRLPYDLDLQAARRLMANCWRKARVAPDQLLTDPVCWAALDYTASEAINVRGALHGRVMRPGTAHGIAVWFDACLGDGIGFSNAPSSPELIYGSAFFPLADPVCLAAEDGIALELRAEFVGEDYVWSWETEVYDGDKADAVKACFRQSTFHGAPLSPQRLRRRAASHVPTLAPDGEIDQFVLAQMRDEARVSVGDIADGVRRRFPDQFPTAQEALTRVGDLSEKYSR